MILGFKRGSSLMEALVALTVFGLVAGLIAGVFILSHRYTRVSQQVSRAQREATHLMQGLYAEFSRGSYETFQPLTAADQVWFLSSRLPDGRPGLGEFSDKGEILWQKWVGVWCHSDGSVYRSELPLPGGGKPLEEIGAGPGSIVAFSVLGTKRRIAAAVRSFTVKVESRLVTVDLESQTSNSGNPPTRYHMASSFLLP